MCGVIVVGAESFWSTWHGRDAFVHDHCLRCLNNYAFFYQVLSMENIWFFFEFFYVWLSYLCKSLRIITLVWPTRLIFLSMEKCLALGSILMCPFPVTAGAERHVLYCIVAIEDKKMGFISYCLRLSLYIMSSCLMRYSILMNLIL